MYAQWKTECPSCGGDLNVVKVKLCATGETLKMRSKLEPDGFFVPAPDDMKDCSTEDEKVECTMCHKVFDLSDLAIDEETSIEYTVSMSMSIEGFRQLREQKLELLEKLHHGTLSDNINGIIHLLDHIQDASVDAGPFSEEQVFGVSREK